jgi:hypothetical protein
VGDVFGDDFGDFVGETVGAAINFSTAVGEFAAANIPDNKNSPAPNAKTVFLNIN